MTRNGSRLWPAIRVKRPIAAAHTDDSTRALPDEERLLLCLDESGPSAIESPGEGEWLIHYAEAPSLDAIAQLLEGEFGRTVSYALEWHSDENWATRTQAALGAITVGQIVVAPPWDRPSRLEPGQLVVEIEPSTGFGTGHHQSTRLCLTALARECRRGGSMLDVGTGSGVLAITAALLGCRPVTAIEIDPDAARAARENVLRNHVEAAVTVELEALGRCAHTATLVFANLTADVICAHAQTLGTAVEHGGRLVVSGIMGWQAPLVLDALSSLERVALDEEEDWVAITFTR